MNKLALLSLLFILLFINTATAQSVVPAKSIDLLRQTSPGTPNTNFDRVYTDSSGRFHLVNSLGVDTIYQPALTAGLGINITGVTISIPQPIATTDTPTFAGLQISGSTLTINGSSNKAILSATGLTADRTYTFPDGSGKLIRLTDLSAGTGITYDNVTGVIAATGGGGGGGSITLPYNDSNATNAGYTFTITNSHTGTVVDQTEGSIKGVATGTGVGVLGYNNSDSGVGVLGKGVGASFRALWGIAGGASSFAVYADGDVTLNGSIYGSGDSTPTSTHLLIGDGSKFVHHAISGDATMTNTGAITVTSLGSKAVSLANSFTTSGNFALTLTQTGTTNVTLPTSGTLQNASGTVTNFSGSLVGDVTGTQGATVVGSIGGKSVVLANSLTTSGNFALTLTQTGTTNVTLPTSGTLQNASGTVTNFSGSLVGDVTGTQGATSVATVGGASAANIADAVTKRHIQNTDTGTTSATFIINSGASAGIIDTSLLTTSRTFKLPDLASSPTLLTTGSSAGAFPTLNQNTTGTAVAFTGSLVGDVTGTQGATSVATVGGASAANIADAVTKRHSQNTDTGTTSATFIVNSGASSATLDTSLLTTSRTFKFPDLASSPTILTTGSSAGSFPTLNQNTTGTSASFTGSLVGDVIGTQGATVVGSIGGKAVVLANSFTTSGNFTLTLTQTGTTNVTLPTSGTLQNASGTVANFSGSLVGDITGTQGATVVSTVGGVAASTIATATGASHTQNTDTGTTSATFIINSAGSKATLDTSLLTANRTFKFPDLASSPTILTTGSNAGSFPTFNQDTTGSAASFTGSLIGDVTGTQGATVVGSIGGKAVVLANSFTTSGNFTLTLTQTGTTNVTLPTSGTLQNASGTVANFSGSLVGDVSGTQGATSVDKVKGITLGTMLATAGYIPVGSGTTIASVAMSGDATLSSAGALTVASIGGKSVSLANSLTTSGNFALTLTQTGTTNVTLPTSGTLLASTGSGGSLTGVVYSVNGSSGAITNIAATNTANTFAEQIQTFRQNGIATTQTDGIVLSNLTAGTGGVNNQYSPNLHFLSHGYNSGDKAYDFRIYTKPSGTTLNELTIDTQDAGGGYTNRFKFDNSGNLTISNNLTVVGTVGSSTTANIDSAVSLKHTQNTDTGTTGSTFTVQSGGSQLILSSTGLTGNRTIAFPDASVTLASLTGTETLTNKTLTSPTLTTPALGVATATSINKLTITAPATSATLNIANGKTLASNNTLTFAGTDSTTITFQGTDTYVGLATTDTLTNKTLTAPKFANAGFIADANGVSLLTFTTTASAVNQVTLANAATTGNPTFTASGTDSDVGINFTPKGVGSIKITSGVTTGTGTSSGVSIASSTVTSGAVVDLASTSTGAASNTQKVLNIATSGANSTTTQTTYGAYISNTHTGTSSTNIAEYLTATGGITNYSLYSDGDIYINGGIKGAGNTAPTTTNILIGDGTKFVTHAISGDGTMSNAGALTVASIGGKSVSLANSLTTSGNFALTLTQTGTTNVTLPTSGTLLASTGSGGSLTGVVYSFAGRSGAVTATSGDYTAAQVTNAADITAANTFTEQIQTFRQNNITTTVTDGMVLSNTTAGTSGVRNQYSPAQHYIAHHYNGADKLDDFRVYLKPTIDTAVAKLVWEYQYASGGYTQGMSLDNSGNLVVGGSTITIGSNAITLGGALTTSGANALTFTTAGTTNVTLPTSGTLQNASGTVANFSGSLVGDVSGTQGATSVDKVKGITLGTMLATAGYIPVGSGTTIASVAVSGDATLSSAGALTVASIGGKSVSLANSLTTSGNFALTLTQTGTTNVTLPTSGTLLTTTGDGSGLSNIVSSVNTRTGAVTGLADILDKQGNSSFTTGDGTEQTAYTYSLAANSLSSTGALRVKFQMGIKKVSSSTSTFVIKMKFGGTTVFTSPALAVVTNTYTWNGEFYIGNQGATNANGSVATLISTAATDSATASAATIYSAQLNGMTVDCTSSQNVVITVTETLGSTHSQFRLSNCFVEVLK